jgi:protein phosphatase-4 regulatory subunit 3
MLSHFQTLTNQGVLPALELALPLHNAAAKAACVDVLNAVVEFSPTIVREYCLHQAGDADDVS